MKINCGGFDGRSVCVGSLSRPLVYVSSRIKPAGWFTTFLRQKWFTRLKRVRVVHVLETGVLLPCPRLALKPTRLAETNPPEPKFFCNK